MASDYSTTLNPKVRRNFLLNLVCLIGLIAVEIWQPLSGGIFKWLYYLIILWVGAVTVLTGLMTLRHKNGMIAIKDDHLILGTGLSEIRRPLSEVTGLTNDNGRWFVHLDIDGPYNSLTLPTKSVLEDAETVVAEIQKRLDKK